MVKSLRVADRGVDGEGQDDWISPALPPLAMIKQVCRDTLILRIDSPYVGAPVPILLAVRTLKNYNAMAKKWHTMGVRVFVLSYSLFFCSFSSVKVEVKLELVTLTSTHKAVPCVSVNYSFGFGTLETVADIFDSWASEHAAIAQELVLVLPCLFSLFVSVPFGVTTGAVLYALLLCRPANVVGLKASSGPSETDRDRPGGGGSGTIRPANQGKL